MQMLQMLNFRIIIELISDLVKNERFSDLETFPDVSMKGYIGHTFKAESVGHLDDKCFNLILYQTTPSSPPSHNIEGFTIFKDCF